VRKTSSVRSEDSIKRRLVTDRRTPAMARTALCICVGYAPRGKKTGIERVQSLANVRVRAMLS